MFIKGRREWALSPTLNNQASLKLQDLMNADSSAVEARKPKNKSDVLCKSSCKFFIGVAFCKLIFICFCKNITQFLNFSLYLVKDIRY